MSYANLEDQIVKDFTEYSKYVNEERAIPDLYDGMKPVARRILFSLRKSNLIFDKPTLKSATIVGRVMTYHPHGDVGIYGAMARMAQPFSLRVPLVYGEGNFGSEEMPPAAQRYTEVKLSKLGEAVTQKLNKGIVPMIPNYDGTETEPSYLYAPVPVLLNTGVLGIGVGMATSIPPFNLNEVIDTTTALIKNPDMTVKELMALLPGPDFPSGCAVVNQSDFLNIYTEGKGSFVLRARFEFTGNTLVIKNLPMYSIAAKIEGQIHSAKTQGALRSVTKVINTTAEKQELTLQLRSRYDAQELIRELCQHTDAERTTHLDLRVLDNGVPKQFTILEYLKKWLHKHYILVSRELELDLETFRAKLEIAEGLKKALIHIDELIKMIKASKNKAQARIEIKKIGFTENQANAILDLKLSRLTQLEAVEIEQRLINLTAQADTLEFLLKNEDALDNYVIQQMEEYKGLDSKRTSIIEDTRFPKVVKVKQDHFHLTFNQGIARVTEETPRARHLVGTSKKPVYLLSGKDIVPVRNSKIPTYTDVHCILQQEDVFHFSIDGYVKATKYQDILSTRKAKVTNQKKVHTVLQGKGFALMTMKSGKQVQFDLADVPFTKRGARGVIAVKLGGEEIHSIELIAAPKKGIPTGRNRELK